MTTPPPLLDGLRVLDLTRQFPGPLCTMMLGDLGAEVIKVEDPASGDMMRYLPPLKNGLGAGFLSLNRSKLSLALNLKSAKGREIFLKLAEKSDIVVEGFRPGVLDRLGIGFERLKTSRSDIILCSISGYGQDGPYRDRAGHDINYCARTGVLGVTGARGGPPSVPGIQAGDVAGGSWQALAAILGALYHRQRTGEGQWLDVAMADGLLSTMMLALQEVLAGEDIPPRGEAALTGGLPGYGIFETSDGRHLAVGALEPHFFDRFCEAVGCPHLKGRGISMGPDGRAIRDELAGAIRRKSRDEWMQVFSKVDACVEPVLEGSEVLSDPQLHSRGMFFTLEHPLAGRINQVATPLPMARRKPPFRPAPALGEHTAAVLGSLGLGDDAVRELAAQGVIGLAQGAEKKS